MPSPIETLLRVHDSPVPTQIVLGASGSIAIAPIDCTVCLSNTGLKVVPPFTDFQIPPLAAPMYTLSLPSSFTAVRADTRPLMVAEPMFRAPSPEIESESNFASCAARRAGNSNAAKKTNTPRIVTINPRIAKSFLVPYCRELFPRSSDVRRLTVHLLQAWRQV